jgi:hypothetical protein
MAGFLSRVSALLFVALALAACGRAPEQRAEWRGQAERECVRSGRVAMGPHIRVTRPIEGPGVCGLELPHRVEAFSRAGTRVSTPVVMTCPMVAAMDGWLTETVQPAAVDHFGSPVVEVMTAGTYNCRRMLNRSYGRMSEHSYANAMDVTGFVLADGRRIRVGRASAPSPSPWFWQNERTMGVSRDGWFDLMQTGPGEGSAAPPDITFGGDAKPFWRHVRNGACNTFSTTLGPGSEDGAHEEHLHLDMARHGRDGRRRICR